MLKCVLSEVDHTKPVFKLKTSTKSVKNTLVKNSKKIVIEKHLNKEN